jgi:hypothetical protein
MGARAVGLLAGAYLSAICLLPSLAWGQTDSAHQPAVLDAHPVGKVMTVKGTAHIEHATAIIVQAKLPTGDVAQTKVDDLVYRGDIIQTGVDGELGITFADGSSFHVSANARMEVDEFVYDPNGNSNSSLTRLVKGTFTFIAGEVAHTGDMKVDTPVATMGIRGTAPRVEISEDGTTKFTTLIEQTKK